MKYAHTKEYKIKFSDSDWEEIVSLGFEPFEITAEENFTRGQWMAIGDMCLGKAQRVEDGSYGKFDDTDADDGCDLPKWAAQLRSIAKKIFDKFQPGDGQF